MPRLRAYLVEDSALLRDALAATLEDLGPVEVVGSAADESTALRWLAQPGRPCDLLIVDIFLQAGSGLGVLRAAASRPGGARAVVLTNHATPTMRAHCLALGADRVFDKSHDIDALVDYCTGLAGGTVLP